MDENVKKVPNRFVGCRGDSTFDPSGVVGELGTALSYEQRLWHIIRGIDPLDYVTGIGNT